MWREVFLAVLFAVRWRTMPAGSALEPQPELDRADIKRLVEERTAIMAKTYWRRAKLLSKVASLAAELDEIGIQRKAAAQLLALYVRTQTDDAAHYAKTVFNLATMTAATLIVAAVGLAAVLSALTPEAYALMYLASAAALAIMPILDRYIPPLGRYDYRLAPLAPAAAVAGYMLGGAAGLAAGFALGAVPHTYLWLARYAKYEKELRKFGMLIETVRQGGAAGRTYLGRWARVVYSHVAQAGAYDLDVYARNVLLVLASYVATVREHAKARALALLAMATASVAVGAFVHETVASMLGQPAAGLPEELTRVHQLDPLPYVFAALLYGAVAGRMYDSTASTVPFAAVSAATAYIIAAL